VPIRDTAAMNRSLDNDYGATHGANSPASFQVALFIGDPMTDGVEVANTTEVDDGLGGTIFVPNGYARVTIANDASWAAAADGEKSTAVAVQFPTALAEYPGDPDHWALFDAANPTQMWDNAALVEELTVTAAGAGPLLGVGALTVFYDDNVEEE
jgi:hypothetical protein